MIGDWNTERRIRDSDGGRWDNMQEILDYANVSNIQKCFRKGVNQNTWCHPQWKSWSCPDHIWDRDGG